MQFGPYNSLEYGYLSINNFQIQTDGKVTHLLGKNGTGKSTLMKKMVQQCQEEGIKYSYLSQNYRENWLWWYTPKQNLELQVSLLGLPKLESLPEYQANKEWLEPLLNKQPSQVDFSKQNEIETAGLSGGQLQRITLFRELLQKPKIIFFDEAFSAMDTETIKDLAFWITQTQQQVGFEIINITHSKEVVQLLPGNTFNLEIVNNQLKANQIMGNISSN